MSDIYLLYIIWQSMLQSNVQPYPEGLLYFKGRSGDGSGYEAVQYLESFLSENGSCFQSSV